MPINYELTGMLLGLAIYNSINLDLKFPLVVYRKLLDEPLELDVYNNFIFTKRFKDLEEIEPEMHKGLKHILHYEGDLETDLGVNYQVTYEYFGAPQVYDLVVMRFHL
jgi:E3 ubiquitin-protein ligase HECTD2